MRRSAANVTVQRQAGGFGGGLGHGQRHTENSVGAEPALVLRAVEFDQRLIDAALILGFHVAQRVVDLSIDRLDRLGDAFAEIAALVAIAQLDGFVRAGRCT